MFIPPLSFAELTDHTFETSIEEGQIYITVQMEIRDSNEYLVGYIETDRITVQNLDELSLILDEMSTNLENTKIMIIDDKKYQVIVIEDYTKHPFDAILSISHISNRGESIAYVNYDGFGIRADDVVITTWTMIRPA
jgi:hypothetical protein|tara:strand:- start:636 stop:1046 length:411 start_codon:yes stop_codon:yes gene_type:complete